MLLTMSVGAFSMFFFSLLHKQNVAFKYWTFSQFSIAIATLLLILRGVIPDFLSIVTANTLLIYGLILAAYGAKEFFNERIRHVNLVIFALLVYAAIFIYYTYIDNNSGIRTGIATVTMFICSALISYLLLTRSKNTSKSGLALAVAFGIHASVYLFRLIGLYKGELGSLINASIYDQVVYAESIIMGVLFPLGYISIMNEKLIKDIREQANIDPLTGLLNRRAFYVGAEPAYARSVREREPVSVSIIDIDRFKSVNDRYGHQVGDKVLTDIAECMRQSLRDSDILARFGGEEFVVFMPGINEEKAAHALDRLRIEYQALIESSDYPPNESTISIGLTSTNAIIGGLEQMLSEADRNLYQAKQNGRNQLVSSTLR